MLKYTIISCCKQCQWLRTRKIQLTDIEFDGTDLGAFTSYNHYCGNSSLKELSTKEVLTALPDWCPLSNFNPKWVDDNG